MCGWLSTSPRQALRYTFETKLTHSGTSQRLTQELMRHSNPQLTAKIYTDVSQLSASEEKSLRLVLVEIFILWYV